MEYWTLLWITPMDCGHTPLDHGVYIAVQLGEKTRAALTQKEPTDG